MKKPLKKVSNLLDDIGLRYQVDKEEGVISMGFNNPDGDDQRIIIIVRESDLIYISPYQHQVPDVSRGSVSDYVHERNAAFAMGSLDYDQEEGRVWFRMTEFFGTGEITREEVKFGVDLCLKTMMDIAPELRSRCDSPSGGPPERMYH